jgi:hypothetical protein
MGCSVAALDGTQSCNNIGPENNGCLSLNTVIKLAFIEVPRLVSLLAIKPWSRSL